MDEREERRGDAPWGKEAASLKARESRGTSGRLCGPRSARQARGLPSTRQRDCGEASV